MTESRDNLQKISLWLEPADIAWLNERARAASSSKSTIARQVIRAARDADERAQAAAQATIDERARALAEGPHAGDGAGS